LKHPLFQTSCQEQALAHAPQAPQAHASSSRSDPTDVVAAEEGHEARVAVGLPRLGCAVPVQQPRLCEDVTDRLSERACVRSSLAGDEAWIRSVVRQEKAQVSQIRTQSSLAIGGRTMGCLRKSASRADAHATTGRARRAAVGLVS
jgi:hypothetical protein